MAEQIIEHTYHLKGGNEDAVNRANPLLDRREPIVVFCNDGITRMKIGDGVHRYDELKFIGEQELCCGKTRLDFPNIGQENILYKAESEHMIYQWNTKKLVYEVLGPDTADSLDVEIISGGTAKDLITLI